MCDMDLVEDEMAHFMMGNFSHCPYFQLYDEYKIVQETDVAPVQLSLRADSVHACMKRWLLRDKLSART